MGTLRSAPAPRVRAPNPRRTSHHVVREGEPPATLRCARERLAWRTDEWIAASMSTIKIRTRSQCSCREPWGIERWARTQRQNTSTRTKQTLSNCEHFWLFVVTVTSRLRGIHNTRRKQSIARAVIRRSVYSPRTGHNGRRTGSRGERSGFDQVVADRVANKIADAVAIEPPHNVGAVRFGRLDADP